MAAIDFPASPTNGQTLTSDDKTWVYSTAIGAWSLQAQTVTGPTGATGATGPTGATGATGATGPLSDTIYTITDGAAFEVDPANGSIQLITLGANRTPKATSFTAGSSVMMMINDGTAYAITWTDSTWGTGGVTWVNGVAPTLATSGYTVIEFWKVDTKVYGALIGSVA